MRPQITMRVYPNGIAVYLDGKFNAYVVDWTNLIELEWHCNAVIRVQSCSGVFLPR